MTWVQKSNRIVYFSVRNTASMSGQFPLSQQNREDTSILWKFSNSLFKFALLLFEFSSITEFLTIFGDISTLSQSISHLDIECAEIGLGLSWVIRGRQIVY